MELTSRRKWLEKKVGKLSDYVWKLLKDKQLAVAGEMDDDEEETLIFQAKLLKEARWWGGSLPPSEDDELDLPPQFFGDHHFRRKTVQECCWAMAHKHPDVISFRDEILRDGPLNYDQALEYVDADGFVRSDAPSRERLRDLIKTLAETYRWRPEDASFFVLCAYVPTIDTFEIKSEITHRKYGPEIGTISITVEPWVTADIVAQMYKDEQERITRRRPRAPRHSRLRLLEFMMTAPNLSWQKLMERFNETILQAAGSTNSGSSKSASFTKKEHKESLPEARPDKKYTDRGNFRRAFLEVKETVLFPGYVDNQRDEKRRRRRRRQFIEAILREEQ